MTSNTSGVWKSTMHLEKPRDPWDIKRLAKVLEMGYNPRASMENILCSANTVRLCVENCCKIEAEERKRVNNNGNRTQQKTGIYDRVSPSLSPSSSSSQYISPDKFSATNTAHLSRSVLKSLNHSQQYNSNSNSHISPEYQRQLKLEAKYRVIGKSHSHMLTPSSSTSRNNYYLGITTPIRNSNSTRKSSDEIYNKVPLDPRYKDDVMTPEMQALLSSTALVPICYHWLEYRSQGCGRAGVRLTVHVLSIILLLIGHSHFYDELLLLDEHFFPKILLPALLGQYCDEGVMFGGQEGPGDTRHRSASAVLSSAAQIVRRISAMEDSFAHIIALDDSVLLAILGLLRISGEIRDGETSVCSSGEGHGYYTLCPADDPNIGVHLLSALVNLTGNINVHFMLARNPMFLDSIVENLCYALEIISNSSWADINGNNINQQQQANEDRGEVTASPSTELKYDSDELGIGMTSSSPCALDFAKYNTTRPPSSRFYYFHPIERAVEWAKIAANLLYFSENIQEIKSARPDLIMCLVECSEVIEAFSNVDIDMIFGDVSGHVTGATEVPQQPVTRLQYVKTVITRLVDTAALALELMHTGDPKGLQMELMREMQRKTPEDVMGS
eukprot:Tbor_TRINITY_DN5880_c1_g1::TRINITY_DN5880_c1_g1_i1::g.5930::m.5930